MSRQETLDAVFELLHELELDEVYGITEGTHKASSGKSAPSLTFCKARILDGLVAVWSPTFIQAKWQTAIRDLPHRHSQVFKSFAEFEVAMREYFGKYVKKAA